MARREKKSIVDVLFDLSAMLPWWASVLVAIVTYLICHYFATTEVAAAKTAAEFAPALQQTILKSLATLGQYVLPVIFLIGAAASAIAQLKRPQTVSGRTEPVGKWKDMFPDQHEADTYPMQTAAQSDSVPSIRVDPTCWTADLLSALEWKRFEMVCAGLFERLGFAARLGTTGSDGGIDIHLSRQPGEPAVSIVQCKAWARTRIVGVDKIRELRGVMASMQLTEGIFATTASFSDDAKAYAKANGIDLMDGTAVLSSILTLTDDQQASLLKLATAGDYTTATCPSCGVKMRKREPKAGGKAFWGCVNFPRCKVVINIAKA